MNKSVYEKENVLETFPFSLGRDVDKYKLADGISEQIAELFQKTDNAEIYTRIDELDEEVLDKLAYDFKIEWYEPLDSVENKRKTVKECIMVHKYKGTKFALETALRCLYDDVEVFEWQDYGGEPYHFKVVIYDTSNDFSKRSRVIEKIMYYKNLRSVLDSIVFEVGVKTETPVKCGVIIGAKYKKIGVEVNVYGLE